MLRRHGRDVMTFSVPTHAPPAYDCPFCALIRGASTDLSTQDDVIYRDSMVTAFIAAQWWPNNPGAVIVVTNVHVENIFGLTDDIGAAVSSVSRLVALAMKAGYDCPGVSTRQHNEPAGGQDVWHYHQHVFPRYENDQLYQLTDRRANAPAARRTKYAAKLRSSLETVLANR